jgi:hypothetical protein
MNGSSYLGEWIMNPKTHSWIPDGRGIVINYQKNLVFMGKIEN